MSSTRWAAQNPKEKIIPIKNPTNPAQKIPAPNFLSLTLNMAINSIVKLLGAVKKSFVGVVFNYLLTCRFIYLTKKEVFMEITWFGQSAFKILGKGAIIVTDPYTPEMMGIKFPAITADILTISHDHGDHNYVGGVISPSFIAKGPGEYEIKGVSFTGTPSYHDNKEGSERGQNVIFTFQQDGIKLCHLGDLGQDSLTDEQLENIGDVDILLIPVGGNYTLDAAHAARVVAQLNPKIIIPMHFKIAGMELPITGVDLFLKEMGKEDITAIPKLSITVDKLPEEAQVVVLESLNAR